MATKADQIRQLAATGLSISEIAGKLEIRYQHVYNTLKPSQRRVGRLDRVQPTKIPKPELTLDFLLDRGFERVASWTTVEGGGIALSMSVPSDAGVYAFALDGVVQYVGVATMGLAKRFYFYAKPGATQRTSIRINGIIKELVSRNARVDVAIAMPENLSWNGLPVHGAAGLELGIIKTYALPWNMRSAG